MSQRHSRGMKAPSGKPSTEDQPKDQPAKVYGHVPRHWVVILTTLACLWMSQVARWADDLVLIRGESIDATLARKTDRMITLGDYVWAQVPWGHDGQLVPVVKRVACAGGDHFVVNDGAAYCNTTLLGRQKTTGLSGRALPAYRVDTHLRTGQIVLMGSHDYSYDSRYEGAIDQFEARPVELLF